MLEWLGSGDGVHESVAGQEPWRREREDQVAQQAKRVRDDDRVAEPRVCVVAAQIHPHDDDPDDDELREPVRPADDVEKPHAFVSQNRPLEIELEQASQVLLQPDHTAGVFYRLRAATGYEAANRLVGDGETGPDGELADGVGRPPGKEPLTDR